MKKTLIVTGSSNSVGRTLLEKATGYDHKIGISRSNPQIEGVIGIKMNLTNSLCITQLMQLLEPQITDHEIHFIHTAGKIKNEFPVSPSDLLTNPQYNEFIKHDSNGDGIDDEVFDNTYIPFDDFIKNIQYFYSNENLRIGVIMSVADFKQHIPPTHDSMIKVNRLIREICTTISDRYDNVSSRVISIGTMATASELKKRINGDSDYRINPETVAENLLYDMNDDSLGKMNDRHLFVPHPEYESYFKNETPEQVIERFKYEYGLLGSKNPRINNSL